jgi:hypothetical protein
MRCDTIRDLDWHLDCEHASEEAGLDAEKKGTQKSSRMCEDHLRNPCCRLHLLQGSSAEQKKC